MSLFILSSFPKEDHWTDLVRFGSDCDSSAISYGKPCNRCLSVQIDPVTAELDSPRENLGPLRMLKSYRKAEEGSRLRKAFGDSPVFGVHCGISKEGKVKVGDEVFVSTIVD